MKKENKKQNVKVIDAPEIMVEKQKSSALIAFIMGAIALLMESSLIFGLIFAIISLVNCGKSKKVEGTAYRSLRIIGMVFSIITIIFNAFNILTFLLITGFMVLTILFLLVSLLFGGLVTLVVGVIIPLLTVA